MRIILSVIMLSFLAINMIMMLQLHRMKKNTVAKSLLSTMPSMTGLIASGTMILLSKERQLAYYGFTLFYISCAWYSLFMSRFSIRYARFKSFKIYQTPIFWLMVAQTAALLCGIRIKNFFTIMHSKWMGRTFWVSRSFFPLYFCVALDCIALLATMVVLITAATKTAKIYRMKYTGIMFSIVLILLCCLFSQQKSAPIWIPVICLAVCEMVIVYLALYYAPKKLNQRTMHFVADQLNDGMVVYNDEHLLQIATPGFMEAFGLSGTEYLEDEQAFWSRMVNGATVENAWNGYVTSVSRDGETVFYELQRMALNEDGKVIGTVYWIRNVTESIESNRIMVRRANFDELTGIYNEAHFQEAARQTMDAHPDKTFVMICSGVAKYRTFKELFGKEKAEEYLLRTSESLKTGLSHIPECRYGKFGESDFYLIMPKESFVQEELIGAIDRITEHFHTNNFHLEVKIGAYEITDPSQDMLAICNKAQMACDNIKGNYGKQILWFSESMLEDALRRDRYTAELTKAIEHGEIQIYLQPQIDKTGKLVGAEALARWLHRDDGFVSPAQFIPYFETNGRITELDICIWRQACQKLKEWKEKGRDDLHISVNISAKDLYALDIYEYYTALVEEYGINTKNLKLEITESAIISDLKQHVRLVERLQEAGFEVEMDDFGSAYSSFNMLKDICVDVLKIDMRFLGNTENTKRSHAILKSIIDLARELDMKTIAEGVETEEQLNFLKSVGCDIYQGYYFSRPISVADFEAKYL